MASNKYIVRQPIKTPASEIIGYELLYHGENQAYGGGNAGQVNEFAVADTIYNFLTQNTEKALKGTLNFMTFTTTLLMKKVPRLFGTSDLVIQIEDSVIIHPLAMHLVQQYKRDGYRVAVNEFQFAPRYLSMLDQIDYIRLNLHATSDVSLHNVIEIAGSMGKYCIATGVDNETLYQKAVSAGVYALEGSYVAGKMATKTHNSGYLKSNFFRLLVAVTRDEPNMDEIERIIAVDASLTYALLRIANSAQYVSRNRTTTIRQAIMKLGIDQLKQWVYLLCAGNAAGSLEPAFEEFLKLSLVRASFCSELLNYTKLVPLSKGEAYLLGMFSTLPSLIDAPMADILAELPVADEVKNALLYRQGPSGALYELVLRYENADWTKVNELSAQLQVPPAILTSLYFDCVEAADNLWKAMNQIP